MIKEIKARPVAVHSTAYEADCPYCERTIRSARLSLLDYNMKIHQIMKHPDEQVLQVRQD